MTSVILQDPDGNFGVAKSYSNAKKLFRSEGKPIGVMTWGAANLGPRTISGLILEFGRTTTAGSVEGILTGLADHIRQHYEAAFGNVPVQQRPVLGIYAAGYSDNVDLPEEWEFIFPASQQPQLVRPVDAFGASWRGVDIPFTRLHFGFDPRMAQMLQAAGVDTSITDPIFTDLQLSTAVAFDAMPVQDAINYAVFALRTTIGYVSFELGPPSCGGPLQVAAITEESGYIWVGQPQFSIQEDFND